MSGKLTLAGLPAEVHGTVQSFLIKHTTSQALTPANTLHALLNQQKS